MSLNKSVREERGWGIMVCCGTTFVMLNPIPNLPVLIGHHKHPFTKQRILGESGIRGWTRQHKALPNGRHWIKPKPASRSLRGKNTRVRRIKLSPSHLLFPLATSTRESTIARARQSWTFFLKRGKRVEMSPPASILA